MNTSQSDSARIAAATAILDRGYGRPTKTTSLEVNTPFAPTTAGGLHRLIMSKQP